MDCQVCYRVGGAKAAFSALILFMHILSSSTKSSDNEKWHYPPVEAIHANLQELNASEASTFPFQDDIFSFSRITMEAKSSTKSEQEEVGSVQEMDHRKRRHSRHKHNGFAKGRTWKHLLQKRATSRNLEQISGKLDYKSFPECWTTPKLSNQRSLKPAFFPKDISFALTHPIFNTSLGLVPGIVYRAHVTLSSRVLKSWGFPAFELTSSQVRIDSNSQFQSCGTNSKPEMSKVKFVRGGKMVQKVASFNITLSHGITKGTTMGFLRIFILFPNKDPIFSSSIHFAIQQDCVFLMKFVENNWQTQHIFDHDLPSNKVSPTEPSSLDGSNQNKMMDFGTSLASVSDKCQIIFPPSSLSKLEITFHCQQDHKSQARVELFEVGKALKTRDSTHATIPNFTGKQAQEITVPPASIVNHATSVLETERGEGTERNNRCIQGWNFGTRPSGPWNEFLSLEFPLPGSNWANEGGTKGKFAIVATPISPSSSFHPCQSTLIASKVYQLSDFRRSSSNLNSTTTSTFIALDPQRDCVALIQLPYAYQLNIFAQSQSTPHRWRRETTKVSMEKRHLSAEVPHSDSTHNHTPRKPQMASKSNYPCEYGLYDDSGNLKQAKVFARTQEMKISEQEKGILKMNQDCPRPVEPNGNALLVGHDIFLQVLGRDRVVLEARLTKRSHDCPDGMVQIGSNKCVMLTSLKSDETLTGEQSCPQTPLKLSPLVLWNEEEWKDTLNLLMNSLEMNQQSGIIPRQAHPYLGLPIQLALSSKLSERLHDPQIFNISDSTTLDHHPSAHMEGCLLQTTPQKTTTRPSDALSEGQEHPRQTGPSSFASLPQFLFLSQAVCHQRIRDSRESTKSISPGFALCSTFHPTSPTLSVTDDETRKCDRSLMVEPGQSVQVTSPQFPKQYPHFANCIFRLETNNGSFLQITFHFLHLEAGLRGLKKGKYCVHDFIEIREFAHMNAKPQEGMIRFCGNWNISTTGPTQLQWNSTGSHQIEVQFVSDFDEEFPGFSFEVTSHNYPKVNESSSKAPPSSLNNSSNSEQVRDVVSSVKLLDASHGRMDYIWETKGYPENQWRGFQIQSPKGTSLRVQIESLDIESSPNCDFDYLMLTEGDPFPEGPPEDDASWPSHVFGAHQSKTGDHSTSKMARFVDAPIFPPKSRLSSVQRVEKLCGTLPKANVSSLHLASSTFETWTNTLWITFKSDGTLSGKGFSLRWTSFQLVYKCPREVLTKAIGSLQVPVLEQNGTEQRYVNYGSNPIVCSKTFIAPVDHRVVLTFHHFNPLHTLKAPHKKSPVSSPGSKGLCSMSLMIEVGSAELEFCPNELGGGDNSSTGNIFISNGNRMVLLLRFHQEGMYFGSKLDHTGIWMDYKIESNQLEHASAPLILSPEDNVRTLTNINYPLEAPSNLIYETTVTAPSGFNIRIALPVGELNQECGESYLEILDPYKIPKAPWRFCHFDSLSQQSLDGVFIYVQSFLGILHLRQVTGQGQRSGLKFKIQVELSEDRDTALKVIQMTRHQAEHKKTDVCDKNLCFNGGRCDPTLSSCVCKGHFIGPHCLQTACDSQPCHNGGVCQLTRDSFSCICPVKFGGKLCDRQLRPCEQDPCSGNGICHEQVVANGHKTFRCQCHLWWAGPRCDRRMTNIPYKPLSSRMIEEPFWLGLLTVLIVLLIIGLCWFLKKHLPDRLDKILVDDMETALVKDRSIGATFRQYTPQVSVASDYNELPSEHRLSLDISPSAAAKTLLSKLSVRKPSILSVSSTASSIGGYGDRKNSTSQEELFIKRTPSPKKRNRFLSPRDEEERRKILKSLVTPKCPKNRHNSLASFDQLIIKAARSAEDLPETSHVPNMFRKESAISLQIPGMISPSALLASKKVTFSHVVDQLACSLSESSSLSDLSCADEIRQGLGTSGPSTKRAKKLLRSSRIPSKRKHSLNLQNNNNGPQNGYSGSEEQFESSMESLESSCTSFPMRSMSMLSPGSAKQARQLHKISSADSLLSMIKSLTAQKGNHASSTPSSPQLSVDGGGESAISSPINPPETPQALGQGSSPRRDNRKESSQSGHQIKVEIHDHPPEDSSPNTPTNAQGGGNSGVMSLEVPGFQYGKCLSPIKELPSPMPTPAASPLPNRNSPGGSQEDVSTSSSTSCSTTSSRRSSFRNRYRKKGSPSITQPIEPIEPEEIRSICVPRIRRNSYTGDTNAPAIYQETSFVVPMRELQPQASPKIQRNATIPKITLTMHDDSLETATNEPQGANSQWGEPASPKSQSVMRSSTLPENILIPQVFVSCAETSQIQSVVSPKNGRIRHRPPPLVIPNSNFQDAINSMSDSKNELTKDTVSKPPKVEIELKEISSSSPIRQPASANLKGKSGPIGINSDVVPDNHPSLLSVHVESPKFLAPDNFDSAPRSRSQSVELPEFRMTKHELCSVSNRRDRPLLLKRRSTDEIPVKLHQPVVNAKVVESGVNRFSAPTSVSARKPTRDERMALLLKQRSLPGGHPHVVPTTNTEETWKGVRLGSPTLKRDPPMFPQMKVSTGAFPPRGSKSSHIRSYDKPQSLDLPGMAPIITITPMSDLESDNDSPIIKNCPHAQGTAPNTGMHYLSPFTINTTSCGSRTTSESNLSSSGYSSMASPGPSRSGSSNPLCYESEDTSSTPTSSSGFFSCGSVSGIISQGVFIRRPSPLLKSPSVDSESSDPNQPPVAGSVTFLRRNNGLWRMHEKALQYSRTDSETTDEQCLPESISTANDSALDSQEEINDDEDTFNPEGVFEESGQMIPTPVSFKSQSPAHGSPTTLLEVRDSSTESDKTVFSMVTLIENTSKDSLPSTPGLSSQMSLPLPEIVVNEALPLDGSSDVHHDSNEVQDEWKRKSEGHVPGSSKCPQLPKASSVPPLGHHGRSPSSNMDYEPLLSCSTVSASSSRSESPMSERIFDKCSSSLLSLHNAQRLADSDGALEYPMGTSIIYSPSSKTQYKSNSPGSTGGSGSRRKKRSNKKRSHLKGTIIGTPVNGEAAFQKSCTCNGNRALNVPFKNPSMTSGLSSPKSRGLEEDDMPYVCSPRKSLIRKKLKSQQHQSTKSEMPTTTSSSNESLFSNISLDQGLQKVVSDSKDDPHFLSVKLPSNSSSVSSGDESGCEGPHKEVLLLVNSSSNSSSLKTSSSSSSTSKTGSPLGSMALLPIPMKLRQQRLRSRRRHARTRLSSESLISATRDHE